MRPLYPDQQNALQLLRQSLGGGFMRPMVQAPTGFGKTVFSSHVIQGALDKGNFPLFVVPSISLVDQTLQSLYVDGIREVGVIQADHPLTDYSKPVQVATVQTLERKPPPFWDRLLSTRIGQKPIVIIDEAHAWHKFVGEWMAKWSNIPFIGLSATPWTKGLGLHYDDLIVAATTAELIYNGRLSPFKVLAPSHPDLSGVKTVAGDYHVGQLSQAMSQGALVADIVSTWKKRGENRPTLAFAVDCAHAQHIAREFIAQGITCGYVDAHVPREERQVIANKFHSGEFQIVVNVGTLTKGIDWDVRCIILARPTKSEILFTQIIGRGLRLAEGKEDCLILDHSDTHLRLGFVTDIHHETLDDGTKGDTEDAAPVEKPEPLPTCCENCSFMKPAKIFVCPNCGHVPVKQHSVETVAGELDEFIPDNKKKINRDTSWDDKEAFFGGLKRHGASKGFKVGWASNQYKEKFGVWPNKIKDAYPREPNADVIGWIKHQNIKYAKRKRA